MKTEHWFQSHLREIPTAECMELLGAHEVGRLAFNDDEGVLVLPVNFAVDDGTILVTTSPTGRLATFATIGSVAFEVDEADNYTESGWSVLVRGTAAVVPADQLRGTAANAPEPWVDGDRTLVLRITPREITGRRLIPA